MTTRSKLAFSAVAFAFVLATGAIEAGVRSAASPQDSAPTLKPSEVVKPQTYVSLEPVPRGKEFQAAVVMEIARGFHINSHKPTEAYLIPTTLTVQPSTGIQLLDMFYPNGQMVRFSFSPDKALDVYTGKVTLLLRFSAHSDAPLGPGTISAVLRYQACNESTCLPPVKVPVSFALEFAGAGTNARVVHSEVFQGAGPSHQK
jgi:DsbC/DsbD-like thiol-disulfide interchange protein